MQVSSGHGSISFSMMYLRLYIHQFVSLRQNERLRARPNLEKCEGIVRDLIVRIASGLRFRFNSRDNSWWETETATEAASRSTAP